MAERIQFFNRYTGEVETEVVCGEQWLRLALFNPFGKITFHRQAGVVFALVWMAQEPARQWHACGRLSSSTALPRKT